MIFRSSKIIEAYQVLSNKKEREEYDLELKTVQKTVIRYTETKTLDEVMEEAGIIVIECEQCGGKTFPSSAEFGDPNEIIYIECSHCGLMVCIN